MDEIKEILGTDHVIFKITKELVDNDEDVDILEKIGGIIDTIEGPKESESSENTKYIKEKSTLEILDELSKEPENIDLITASTTSPPKLAEGSKNSLINSGETHVNPFKKENTVEKIGWTDWIRSFIIYDKKKTGNENKNDDYELSYEELRSASRNRSALPRLIPEWPHHHHSKSARPKQIIFGGCAGMYHYFLGIASILQEKFYLDDVVFGCVSGGSFPALALILGLPVKDLHETWNKEILRELNNSPLKAFSRLNGIVFEKSKKYIPFDAHLRAKDRLFISLTEFPSLKNHIVHYWKTIDSLLDCIQASCFIPIFDTRFWTIFDQTKYIDGGLSNNKPIPYPDAAHIYITTDRWREIPLHWYWCYTSESWSDQLFNWGIEDTLAHLDDFSFLTPKAS